MVFWYSRLRKLRHVLFIHLWLISHYRGSWVVVTGIGWPAKPKKSTVWPFTEKLCWSLIYSGSMKVGYSQCKTRYEKLWILCKISIMLVKIVTLTVDSRGSKGIFLESEFKQVGNRPNYTLREKSLCFVLFRYQPFALWADKYCLSFNASVAACCTHWKYKIYSDVCSLFLMTKAGLIA